MASSVATPSPIHLAPALRRLTAPNPSPFTFTGTQTYIVGVDEIAVIDPGPAIASHIDAICAAIGAARLATILVTHNHRDHSPAAAVLAARTGAPIVGARALAGSGSAADAAFDPDYRPDRALDDGEAVATSEWTLRAVATPGHTSNHLCFAWDEERVLFSGDHAMGWSTTVVVPPDGDMGDYMASLETLAGRADRLYYPGHGDPVERPARLVRSLLGHRRQREGQILRLIGRGTGDEEAMVARMYVGLDPRLIGGARMSVRAHLIDLERRGLVVRNGDAWERAA